MISVQYTRNQTYVHHADIVDVDPERKLLMVRQGIKSSPLQLVHQCAATKNQTEVNYKRVQQIP